MRKEEESTTGSGAASVCALSNSLKIAQLPSREHSILRGERLHLLLLWGFGCVAGEPGLVWGAFGAIYLLVGGIALVVGLFQDVAMAMLTSIGNVPSPRRAAADVTMSGATMRIFHGVPRQA